MAPASAKCQPAALQALFLWHLSPGVGGCLRPTPGHRVVLLVEDIHVAAANGATNRTAGALAAAAGAAGAADYVAPGGAGLQHEVYSGGVEWLRHVMDDRAVTDSVTGTRCVGCRVLLRFYLITAAHDPIRQTLRTYPD